MITIKGQDRTSEELNRYALIKEYYVKNKGTENFNSSYLIRITDRLLDISSSSGSLSEEVQKKSDELFEFFAQISNYI